jgi:hypothetical protein
MPDDSSTHRGNTLSNGRNSDRFCESNVYSSGDRQSIFRAERHMTKHSNLCWQINESGKCMSFSVSVRTARLGRRAVRSCGLGHRSGELSL